MPNPQPQATMTVPEYMLPIMAMAEVGHLSPNQPVIPGVSGIPPPKASGPVFTNSLSLSLRLRIARITEVRAVQQFPAELLSTPEEQRKSPSQLVHAKPAVSRESTPVRRDEEMGDVVEATSTPLATEGTTPGPVSTERGRPTSITQRLKAYWPSLKSFSGSDRRPRSPTIPPRPETEPAPKRAASMPRISDPAPAESTSDTAQPATASPSVAVPTVQIPAPPATQSQAEPSAPEVTSDAETLALPGIPGPKEDGAPPSPIEEEGPTCNG